METVDVTCNGFRSVVPPKATPTNFSFVLHEKGDPWNGEVAGSGLPSKPEQVESLYRDLGITLIVSLTEECRVPNPSRDVKSQVGRPLRILPVGYLDGGVPTKDVALRILNEMGEEVRAGGRVLVHCYAGVGRTGTILALWVAWRMGLGAKDAINLLREFRSSSMRWGTDSDGSDHPSFDAQQKFVRDFLDNNPRPKEYPRAFLSESRLVQLDRLTDSPIEFERVNEPIQRRSFETVPALPFDPLSFGFSERTVESWNNVVPHVDRSDTAKAALNLNRDGWVHFECPAGWGKSTLLRAIKDTAVIEGADVLFLDVKECPTDNSQEAKDWLDRWNRAAAKQLGITLRSYDDIWDHLDDRRDERKCVVILDHLDWLQFCPNVLSLSMEGELCHRQKLSASLVEKLAAFCVPLARICGWSDAETRTYKRQNNVCAFSASRYPVDFGETRRPGLRSSFPIPPPSNPDFPVGLLRREVEPLLRSALFQPNSQTVSDALAELDDLFGVDALDPLLSLSTEQNNSSSNCPSKSHYQKGIDALLKHSFGGNDWTTYDLWGNTKSKSEIGDDFTKLEEAQNLRLLTETWQISPMDLASWFSRRISSTLFRFDRPKDPADVAVVEILRRFGRTLTITSQANEMRHWELCYERITGRGFERGDSIPAYLDGTHPSIAMSENASWALHRGLGNWRTSSKFALAHWRLSKPISLEQAASCPNTSDSDDNNGDSDSQSSDEKSPKKARKNDPYREHLIKRVHERSTVQKLGLVRLRENGQEWYFKVPAAENEKLLGSGHNPPLSSSSPASGAIPKLKPLCPWNLIDPCATGHQLAILYRKLCKVGLQITIGGVRNGIKLDDENDTGRATTKMDDVGSSKLKAQMAELLIRSLNRLREAELQVLFLYWLEHAWLRPEIGAFRRTEMEHYPRLGSRWTVAVPRNGRTTLYLSDRDGHALFGLVVRTKEQFADQKWPEDIDFGEITTYDISRCELYVYHKNP